MYGKAKRDIIGMTGILEMVLPKEAGLEYATFGYCNEHGHGYANEDSIRD